MVMYMYVEAVSILNIQPSVFILTVADYLFIICSLYFLQKGLNSTELCHTANERTASCIYT